MRYVTEKHWNCVFKNKKNLILGNKLIKVPASRKKSMSFDQI